MKKKMRTRRNRHRSKNKTGKKRMKGGTTPRTRTRSRSRTPGSSPTTPEESFLTRMYKRLFLWPGGTIVGKPLSSPEIRPRRDRSLSPRR